MFTRILLALAVLSAMSISSTQSHLQNIATLPTEVTVIVRSPATGRQAAIPAQQRLSALQYGQTVTVYDAEVTPTVLASLIDSSQKWDSSRAVKVTIWMYWDGFDSGGRTYVSVSKYQTMWQLYDSSVSMRSASMNAGCLGYSWPGYISCIPEKSQSRWIGIPTSGAKYSLSPSWAGNYIEISGEMVGYQAGNSKVQLKRGTATWWLEICIYKGSCAQLD